MDDTRESSTTRGANSSAVIPSSSASTSASIVSSSSTSIPSAAGNDEEAVTLSDNEDGHYRRRLCYFCFGTDQDDEQQDVWVCPCQCKGTVKWVHEECLQRWIDEKQKRTNSSRVSCSQCKTYYILTFPPVNWFVRIIERYDKFLYDISPYFAVSVVIVSTYWCCGSYGYFSIIQFMGYEDGRRIIDGSDLLLLVIGLPVIPFALIMAKSIKWEQFLLKLWRTSASKLPKPISYIIGEPPAKPRANCDQLLLDPGFIEPIDVTRALCGALLLPSMSAFFGNLLFSKLIPGSQWRRSLVGGLAFLFVKGMMKIYLKKSQYIKYSQRTINNYNPTTAAAVTKVKSTGSSATETQTASSSSRLNQDSFDGNRANGANDDLDNLRAPGYNGQSSRLSSGDNRLNQDDSDDESLPPRALFSMTIRI